MTVSTLAIAAALIGLPVLAQAEDLLPLNANKAQIDQAFGADASGMATMGHGSAGSTGHAPGITGHAPAAGGAGHAPGEATAPHGTGPVASKPGQPGFAGRAGGVAAAPPALGFAPGVMLRRLAVGDLAPVPAEAPSRVVGVPGIQFNFDSAELTAPSQYLIDQIGDALARKDWFVTVVGHTDAVGDPGYNIDLSQRRALTVAFYLVNMHGVSPARIAYTGVGATQPIDANDPFAPENRRVTFILQE
jgi:outer membrane protein OmpA-like peptidoglycan-associated protein